MLIRELRQGDRPAITAMLIACGAFNEEEIGVALEMVDAGLTEVAYPLLALEIDGAVRGYVCLGETPLTASTWDIYWMCIDPAAQRGGAGRALLEHAEEFTRERGGERIRVETSGRGDYARAREFYRRAGYRVAGVITDFYKAGDDCVIFCKELK